MKKVLGSISLLVLMFNTLLTPLTYAEEYSEIVETSSENAAEEVLEETGEEEVAPEFFVEENTEEDMEENAEDEEIDENEEIENSTGDIVEELSGDAVEIGSGDNTELITGENSELMTGETIELATGDITEVLTGDVEESSGTGEETIVEEIKYNEEPIIGEKTYDDVTVKVEALSGTFPEGTELNISPIRWWNLWNLKDKLVEEKEEIKKDTTVVAFDITFIYEGEEVQPKDGEKVKVTFDYSNNDDLIKVDNDESKSVRVYHIEDKDSEGNELEKEEQRIIEVTNKEESTENGIAVADADSFSVYLLTYGNEDPEFSAILIGDDDDRNNNFHYKTITISDGEHIYTLMDRNLGARVAWNTGVYSFGTDNSLNYDTADDYYGYYYQWGNNYGFSAKRTELNVGGVLSDAIPSNYVSNRWNNPYPSGLGNNLRGNRTNTESARQGPCPRGWHVPSVDEWTAIRDAWCVSADKGEMCIYYSEDFAKALQMPTAGYRWYDHGKLTYSRRSEQGYYWSSTSNNDSTANYLLLWSRIVTNNPPYERVNGFPVRCLKNNTDAVTLYLNPNGGKVENAIIDADAQGKVTLPTATRNEYNFDGWYDAVDGGNRIGGSGNEITIETDTDLYAHWASIPTFDVIFNNGANVTKFEVEDGLTLTNEQIQQVSNLEHIKATFDGWYTNPEFTQTFDFSTPITSDISLYAKWTCKGGYIQLQGNGGPDMNCFVYGTLSYEDISGKEHFLMDRNLGAQITGFGTEANPKSYGYYYQWGNNYGFGPSSTTIKSSTQVDCTNINPSAYTSSTFITGLNDFDWCSSKNDNLWGGSTDGSNNNRGLDTISNTDLARKGPCPEGWHIPSIGERQALLIYGASLNSGVRKTGAPFNNYEMSSSNFTKFTNDFKIPIAGQLAYEGAQLSNNGGGGSANLWSSSPDIDSDVWARHLNLNIPTFEASANARNLRAYGFPVRCFMNELKNTLTLNAGEGTVDLGDGAQSIATIGIVKGESFTIPMPIRSDHSFDGWFIDANENGKYDEGEVMKGNAGGYTIESMDEDLTFTAKWKVIVTFDGNGGNPDKESDSGQPGDTIILPGATQDGKEFSGWVNSGDNYVGTSGGNYTLSIIETLKALWYDNVVFFVYANGERAENPIFVNNGGNITLPSVASISGFTFDGWYDAAVGGNKIGDAGSTIQVNESRTLYVQGHYDSVELVDNNTTTTVGSGDVVNEVIGFPITMTVTENDISKSVVGKELSEVEGKEIAGDVTIDFGGVDAKFSHLVKVKIPVKGSSKAYVKVKHVSSESYNYDGLTTNIEASCNDGNIENSDHSYDGAYMDVESGYVSIYTCEASSFAAFGLPKVTFLPNNGEDSIIVEVESGATVNNEDIPNLSNSEDFLGWYTDNGTFENAFDFNTPIAGDITLYAKWQSTVTFDTDGGIPVPEPQIVATGAYATQPETNPTKTGYIFTGWYQTGSDTDFDFEHISITGNMTLYAKYSCDLSNGFEDKGNGVCDCPNEAIQSGNECVVVSNEEGLITIDSPSPLTGDGPVSLIIMDRNLGATMTGYGAEAETGSYGYFYQWGNSYGFDYMGDFETTGSLINVSGKTYYSGNVMQCSNASNWMTPVSFNFWGGEGGQGPCPEGWHVPTSSEYGYLYGYYAGEAGASSSTIGFLERFNIPYMGYYNVEKSACVFAGAGTEANLWSSTLKTSANKIYTLSVKNGQVLTQKESSSAYAKPVRCFRDYVTVSFVFFGPEGVSIPSQVVPIGGKAVEPRVEGYSLAFFDSEDDIGDDEHRINFSDPIPANKEIYVTLSEEQIFNLTYDYNGGSLDEGLENPDHYSNYQKITLHNPKRDSNTHFTFIGWIGIGLNDPMMEVTIPRGSVGDRSYKALYTCDYGYIENNEGECVEISDSGIKYDLETQTITVRGNVDGSEVRYTIQDRNVGATETGAYNVYTDAARGKYYQYGNNNGLYKNDAHTFLSSAVDVGNIEPSTYYGNLVKWDGPFPYVTSNGTGYLNLWGYYSETNDWEARRGPCPLGYHVPSDTEFTNIIKALGSSTRQNTLSQLRLPGVGWGYSYNGKLVTGKDCQEQNKCQGKYQQSKIDAPSTRYYVKFENNYNGKMESNDANRYYPVRCFQDYADCDEGEHVNGFYCAHKLTFNNSGSETSNLVNVIRGVTVEPEEPERAGYNFEGWYENLESGDEFEFGNALSEDVILYAKWNKIGADYDVEVEIIPFTGGNVTGTGVYSEGDVITLTATPNEGYQFTGWYDESDNLVSNNNPYIFTADASDGTGLKAVFELKQYAVSVQSNDTNKGIITYPVGPYTHGMRVVFSPSVTNPLYKFFKWSLNGNDVLTGNNKFLTGDLIIESVTGNVNVIGYFTGYDSCSFNNQIIQHGQSVTGYKASSVTCPNSCESQQATCNNGSWDVENFVENYKSSTCTHNEYSCGEGFTLDTCPAHGICSEPCTPYTVSENACVPGTQKVKLINCVEGYHIDNNKCTANEYAVIFDANGGEGVMSQDTATYGSDYTFKNSNFTKEGSTFSGWNTKADKSGIRYYSGETMLWSLTGDLTLYAQWKLNTYTVTYDAASHSGTINNQPTSGEEVVYNSTITLPTASIVSLKSGYNFIGWTTTLNGTEPISNTYTVKGNVTFYPIFKKEGKQKDIKFYVNNNSGYIYDNVTYRENKLFSGCTIPTLYNTDPYTGSCSVHITLPDIIAHENTQTVLGWSTGINERTISYGAGAGVTITIPENKEVELYAQTRSEEKTYTATYTTDNRVEEVTKPSDICTIPVTYNGNPQQTVCTEAITLPNITAKNGYNTPVWKLGEAEYASGAEIALSGNVIFTGTATPDEHTQYIVKHYYQSGDTNIYELSGTDTLSGATETILDLSTLQVNPNSIPGFTYWNSRVNSGSATSIDVTTINDFTNQGEIQPGLVIQLFYTRKSNPVTLNTIENVTVEKIPSKGNYYYGESITFSGHANSGYTFSGWDIREGDAETGRREGNSIEYTMISTGVEVTPVIREHRYTIHYNASGAVGTMDDETVNYSEEVTLPTSGEVATHFTYTGHHFVGWTTGVAETTVIAALTKATPDDNGEITLYAKWEVNDGVSYSVEYYLEPIEEGRPQSEYILQTADTHHGTAPQGTTVTGTVKNYPGFTSPEAEAGTAESEGSLVIKYYYTRNSYDYTFAAGEGAEFSDGTTSKTVSFRYEQSVALPGGMTLIKTGFTFSNWNPVLGLMPSEAKTSTAEWTENQYTITYNANGGAGTTPSQTVRYTEEVALTGNAFTKEGYVFTGWSKTTDGAVEYKDKALVSKLEATNNATVTLYAQWSAENYTVTLDANSGEVIPTTIEVTYDATYGELPTPNRTGYTFQGWYTAKEGGTKVISSTQVKTANDHTLYAHWTENHYTIAFNANGGEGTMASITNIPYSESTTLTENVFTRNGYRFVGWARTSTSTVKEFNDKASVKELTGENNAIVTLYALWSKGSYKIDYVLNGGALTGGKTNLTGYDVDTASFTLNNPERDGYKFIGWSGTAIDGLSGTVTVAQGSTGDRVYEANWEVKTYTINYELNTGALPAGQTNPATYTIESEDITLINPIRTGYDFNGWSGTAIEGTGNTVTITHGSTGDRKYEANWKVKTYTVTWKNSTGTVLKEEILPYGATPDYGGTPTSGADAQYTYTFAGWEPEIASVTEDQVYTATYNQTVNTYTIRFVDEDGTELYTSGVAYGTTPVYSGAEPTKENTAQYTYIFKGWEPALAPVTGEAIYTATYTGTINKYMITFVDEDGTELKAGVEYDYGTTSGAIVQPNKPTKTGDAQYSYIFTGWTPELTGVTKDQVYTAVYEQKINSYPITFYDEDGVTKIKGPTLYPYGTLTGVIVPVPTPTKDSDGTYTYEFDKWTPELKTVVGTADYRATYTGTYIDYLVTFLDSTGAVLTSGYYHSGENPTIPAGPAKASTAQTGYTFNGWYPEVKVVTGDITYEPTYTETTRSYTITWLSSTGETLRTDTLLYGSTPSYGENPTSGSTAEYEYTFKSWEPAIQTVTEDATYTATYDSTKRKYPITWNNEDGTAIGVTDVEYGVVPAAPSIPKKAFTEQTGYVFNGWNPSPVAVTEAATYTATYAEYLREYTILWKDYDGTVIKTGENVSYGTLIVNNKPTPDPSRESTAQTGYTFTGWYDENGVQLINSKKLTGDTEYTARYDEETRSYTIIWKDRNGTELEKDENVLYGTNPVYDSNDPTSGSTAQYVYTFNGWSPGVHSVTGPEVYTAVYKNTLRSYPITFYDEDGITVVKPSTMYPYGTPGTTYKPLTNPTKKGYSFEKWIPDLEAVVGTADYKASYKINSYKVTPVKGVGVADIIGGGTYGYNTVITLTGFAKAGYHFEGGETVKEFYITVPANSVSVNITADPNTYYVRYNPGDGTGVMLDQEFLYDQVKELNANTYTNEGLYFKEWTDGVGHQYKNKAKVKNLATTGVVDLFAIWTDTPEPIPPTPSPTPTPGESAAGGGRSIPTEDEHESADLQTGAIVQTGNDDVLSPDEVKPDGHTITGTIVNTGGDSHVVTGYTTRTQEEMNAYKYAYKYHITTLAPREAAMPDEYVQRGHMAKMVVNYALNVLHRKLPDKLPKQCKWKDGRNAWESQEIKDYAEKACALGLMGIDMDYFQPNKYVTRAQFGTILGRLLRGKLPSTPYYAAHLRRLKEEGIMTQIENPEDRIEIRKWAWLMFMRSEKYFKI